MVLQSDESDLEVVCNKLYNDDEDTSGMNLDINKVHHHTGRSSSEDGGSNSNGTSTSKHKASRDVVMENNKGGSVSTGGGGDGTSHVALTQDLANTSLQAKEVTPSQNQVHNPCGSEGLAPAGK